MVTPDMGEGESNCFVNFSDLVPCFGFILCFCFPLPGLAPGECP